MQLTGNTVLVTGGGSGIGRGFAVAMHRAGNRVVVAGRRAAALRTVTEAYPGMESLRLDVSDNGSIREFVDCIDRDFADLNVVINNAGIMAIENVASSDPATVTAIVSTNLLGPMMLTSLLLPRLLTHSQGAIINVSSALAFVPLAVAPTYSATKAGLHSYTESLRHQLRDSPIQVIEIAPPRVRTDMVGLGGGLFTINVDEFIAQAMAQLTAQPEATEIIVDAAKAVRYAERNGVYAELFAAVNSTDAADPLEELS